MNAPDKSDRYGGESVGKKLARYTFWHRAKAWMGERFFTEKHLILASREGGDISVLRGFGVPDRNIVAVDSNRLAARECQLKYPNVVICHGDVGEVAKRYRKQIGVAFLDFCSWPTDESLDTIFRVAANAVRDESVLGYAFMRGRESGDAFSEMQKLKDSEQATLARFKGMMQLRGAMPRSREPVCDGRSSYIYNRVQERLSPLRVALFTLARINYHSSCAWRRGVPMSIWAKWIHRNEFSSPTGFTNKCREITSVMWQSIAQAQASMVNSGGETDFIVAYGDREIRTPIEQAFDREFISMKALVDYSNQIEDAFPGKAHLLLNVSRGRLAAWRAHRTMGTYDKAG
jgi:hypothetical protein